MTDTPITPLTAVIVDDEAPARRVLRRLLHHHCRGVEVVAEAATIDTAAEALSAHRPGVLFLDIELRGADGFSLLDRVELGETQLVFVTAYRDYALDAFRAAATDYVTKPVDLRVLREAVGRAREAHARARRQPRCVYPILHQGVRRLIDRRQIICVEADGSYAHLVLVGGTRLMVGKKLGQVSEELDDRLFMRIHRSTLVNLDHVRGIGGSYVELTGDNRYPVSRGKLSDLKARLLG